MTAEYPRVLVVDGEPFSRSRNGGIVKSQLFAGWPKERLCQLTYSTREASFDVCERYWRLSTTDVVLGAFGRAPGATRCVLDKADAASSSGGIAVPGERPLRWLSPQIRVPLSYGILHLPSVLSAPLCRWIDAFHPELLFSFTASGVVLSTLALITDRWNIPLLPYFGDDWITTAYRGYIFGPVVRRNMAYWFSRCLAVSPIRLTATGAMAAEYAERYGGRFEVMHYAEALRPYSPPPAFPAVRFVFTGTLAPQRWPCLEKLGRALDLLAGEGINGQLLIYTYAEDLAVLASQPLPRAITLAGTASPQDIATVQTGANVLVHVESFDPMSRSYTRLSLSTKLPQYFMAGRCVLAVGPAEGASIQYVAHTGAGVAVTDDSLDALKRTLRILITDEPFRRSLGEKAYRAAIERHDETHQRVRFRSLLRAAAGHVRESGL